MENQWKKHVTMLGALYIGMGLLSFFVAAIVFVVLWSVGLAVQDEMALRVLGIVGTSVPCMLALFALPGLIAGMGLLKRKEWARILALILAVFKLFNIPFGTVVGVYAFWVLLQDEVTMLFSGEATFAEGPLPPLEVEELDGEAS